MRSITAWVLVTVGCVVSPAVAEEIVYLTSGAALPVRGHEIKGDMIHLDLGGDSFIAFPKTMVERIDGAEGIELKPSRSNVIDGKPDPQGSFPARGLEVSRTRERPTPETSPNLRLDPRMGIVGWVDDPSKGERSTVFNGRREVLGLPSADEYRGTSRLGNKYVIQGGPKPAARAMTVGIRPKSTATYPPPGEPVPAPDPSTPPPTEEGGAPPAPGDDDSGG